MNATLIVRSCCALLFTAPLLAHAVGFGVYDPRTLALGGTGVAMGDLGLGHLYNPAHTALHRGDEDTTRDGRHSLPAVIGYSSASKAAYEAVENDIENRLSNAIDAFNANPGIETALNGERVIADLQATLRDIGNGNLFADAYTGYSLSEPGEREGGAFFVGTRIVGSGVSTIDQADLDLLDSYSEALRFIQTGGAEGTANPNLFQGNGQLADPTGNLVSSARAQVGAFTEIGVSVAKMLQIGRRTFSFGIAPKATNVILYDNTWQARDGALARDGSDQSHWSFNLDVGMLWIPGDHWKVGLSSKDILTKHYTSPLGYRFTFKPRTRLGFAYEANRLKVGMDLDVVANQTLSTDQKQQDITLGAEYTLAKNLDLRVGYYHDLQQTFSGKLSFGVGYEWRRLSMDLAYALGSDDSSFGLQISLAQ